MIEAAVRRWVGAGICLHVFLFHAAAALAAPAIAATEPSGFQLVENRVYYPIGGDNLQQLKQQLQEHRLQGDVEHYSVGLTEQNFATSYRLDPQAQGCRISEVSVKVEVTIRLPQWHAPHRPSADLKRRWEHMMAGLTRHEEGHRDNAAWAGRELQRRLAQLDAATDCKSLRRQAQRIDYLVMLRLQTREQIYEDHTRSGIAQGSVL